MKDALADVWSGARSGIPFNENFGICKYWMANYKTLGSPLGWEHAEKGITYQAFANGIVKWEPGKGASLV